MKSEDLWIKSMEFGSRIGCHQRADRSFYIKGYQFPVCARCTGIIFATVIGYSFYIFRKVKLICGLFLCIPMVIDGGIQYLGIKESTNFRRLLTGILGGIGLAIIRLNIYAKLISVVLKK